MIVRHRTLMGEPVAIDKRVAITLWWLSNIACYRVVAQQFRVSQSTAAMIVMEVCLVMEEELLPKTIGLREPRKVGGPGQKPGARPEAPHVAWQTNPFSTYPTAQGWLPRNQLPAMCQSHGRDTCADLRHRATLSGLLIRKFTYSMHLQMTTDHKGGFVNGEVGHSGCNHELHVFKLSGLCVAMDGGIFIPGDLSRQLSGVRIPPLMMWDVAYPLREWLMRPYGGQADACQKQFYICLVHAHNDVECAFGHLRATWRCLTVSLTMYEENITSVIIACTVLHNLCEERGHVIPEDPIVGQPVPCTLQMQWCGTLTGSSRSWAYWLGTPLKTTYGWGRGTKYIFTMTRYPNSNKAIPHPM